MNRYEILFYFSNVTKKRKFFFKIFRANNLKEKLRKLNNDWNHFEVNALTSLRSLIPLFEYDSSVGMYGVFGLKGFVQTFFLICWITYSPAVLLKYIKKIQQKFLFSIKKLIYFLLKFVFFGNCWKIFFLFIVLLWYYMCNTAWSYDLCLWFEKKLMK